MALIVLLITVLASSASLGCLASQSYVRRAAHHAAYHGHGLGSYYVEHHNPWYGYGYDVHTLGKRSAEPIHVDSHSFHDGHHDYHHHHHHHHDIHHHDHHDVYRYYPGYGHSVVKRGLGYGGFYGPYGFPGYGFHAYGGASFEQRSAQGLSLYIGK